MTIISLIAAVDEAGGLGFNNKLLCHLPADLHHFKTTTLGKPIIMGRHTFESIGKPLPGRLNIVLSRSITHIDGVLVLNSFEQALEQTADCNEIMIIGGAELFKQTIQRANRLYITNIHHQFLADAFFPDIDKKKWLCRNMEYRRHDEKNKYDMTFCIFEKDTKAAI